MIDHYPRIRAQQENQAELAAIEELEQRAAPLIGLVYALAFAAVLIIAVDGWGRYKDLAAYYTELEATHKKLVQCIKGRTFDLDGAVLSCHVTDYKLVEGLKS